MQAAPSGRDGLSPYGLRPGRRKMCSGRRLRPVVTRRLLIVTASALMVLTAGLLGKHSGPARRGGGGRTGQPGRQARPPGGGRR